MAKSKMQSNSSRGRKSSSATKNLPKKATQKDSEEPSLNERNKGMIQKKGCQFEKTA